MRGKRGTRTRSDLAKICAKHIARGRCGGSSKTRKLACVAGPSCRTKKKARQCSEGVGSESEAVRVARSLFKRGKITLAELNEITSSDSRLRNKKDGNSCPTAYSSTSEPEVEGPIDPIMLVPLGAGDLTYTFIRPNGTEVLYGLATLVDYMLASGSFSEPETRLDFGEDVLRELDDRCRAAGWTKPSLVEARKDASRRFAEEHFRRDALVGLERCCGELVAQMIDLIEVEPPPRPTSRFMPFGGSSGSDTQADTEVKLLTEVFPQMKHHLSELFSADAEYASMCVRSYLSFLRGPRNRPTVDHAGVLKSCLRFLEGFINGQLARV